METETLCFFHPDGRLLHKEAMAGVFAFRVQELKRKYAEKCGLRECQITVVNESRGKL